MTTAYMARELGRPVTPQVLQAADGNKIACFICGGPPDSDGAEYRYVELFICGVAMGDRNVAHVTGLSYTVWFEVAKQLDTLSTIEVLEQIRIGELRLEEAYTREHEEWYAKNHE